MHRAENLRVKTLTSSTASIDATCRVSSPLKKSSRIPLLTPFVGTFWHHLLGPHFWYHLLETSDTTRWKPYLREVPRVSWLLCGSRPNRTHATNAITRPSSSCRNVYYSRVNYLTLHVAVTVQSQLISTVQVNRSQHTREQRFHSSHPWTPVDYEVQLHSTVNYQRQQSTQLLLHWNATPTELRTEVNSTALRTEEKSTAPLRWRKRSEESEPR